MAGEESPRAKLIGLMYLVFIAMLAMNMGKKVLSSFGFLNEKLEAEHIISGNDVGNMLASLKQKSEEQPEKYKDIYQSSLRISEISDALFNHVVEIKKALYGKRDEKAKKDYEAMDGESDGDVYFFQSDSYTEKGKAFIEAIEKYKKEFVEVLGEKSKVYAVIKVPFEKSFDISDIKVSGGKQPWLKNHFEGFPLIATLTNLSVIQKDIRFFQQQVYANLLGYQLKVDAAVTANNYQAIVLPDKPVYFQGERFSGKVVLGRYDKTLIPKKLIINGRTISERKDGAAYITFPTGKVGENPINGEFHFLQEGMDVVIPVKSSYMVVKKPQSAVISADKMNVVYRGVDNPITISMPGITDNNLKVEAEGIRKVPGIGKYLIRPGKGKEIKIKVVGTSSDGTKIPSSTKFRIKDIPSPVASIRGEFGSMKIPLSGLKKSVVEARLVDFDFDLKLRVNSFKMKVPGQATVIVSGGRMDPKAQRALARAKRGDVISIFDVEASVIGNAKYKLKKILPLSIEINN